MRAIIDCNVLVSGALVDGNCRGVIDAVLQRRESVLSGPILAEYQLVCERPKHAPYRDVLWAVIQEFKRFAGFLKAVDVVFGLRDPDDEICLPLTFVAAAWVASFPRI